MTSWECLISRIWAEAGEKQGWDYKTRMHTSTLRQGECRLDCAKLFHILQHAARASLTIFMHIHKHLAPNPFQPISDWETRYLQPSGLSFSESNQLSQAFLRSHTHGLLLPSMLTYQLSDVLNFSSPTKWIQCKSLYLQNLLQKELWYI